MSNDTQVANASNVRSQMRALRRGLSDQLQCSHADRLSRQLRQHPKYLSCKRIACYLPNDGEISPLSLMETALLQRKQLYLPVLSPLQDSLYFAPFDENSATCTNRFGITEPACHPRHWVRAQQIDLMLLPLVAFDEHGNRLGMGGGFYDRSLAYLGRRKHWKKPCLIGLAHELQKTDHLPSHCWDIPLNAIVTESNIYIPE